MLFFFETKSSVSILFSLSGCSHSPVGGTHTYSSAPSRLRHTRASMRISWTRNGRGEWVCLESHRKEREKGTLCVKQTLRSPIPMSSPRYGHPEAHRAFGRDIIYTITLYYILYRAPGVANGNNHFLLHAAVHPGLHCTELAGWTLIGCYVRYVTLLNADWLSLRECRVKV